MLVNMMDIMMIIVITMMVMTMTMTVVLAMYCNYNSLWWRGRMRGVEEDCREWADRNQLTFLKDQQCLATFLPEIATSHCLLCHHNHGPVIIPMHLRYCLPFPYQSMGQPHPWPSAVPRGRIEQLQGTDIYIYIHIYIYVCILSDWHW